MICKFYQQKGSPEFEVDKFSSNHLKYQYFSTLFKEVIERKIKDYVGRLTRLVKFADGKVKALIKHCTHLIPDIGYDTTITLLNKRYGNSHSLLSFYRKNIKLLAPVKPVYAIHYEKYRNFI